MCYPQYQFLRMCIYIYIYIKVNRVMEMSKSLSTGNLQGVK